MQVDRGVSLGVIALALAACSADSTLPEGAELVCDFSEQCPDGLVCTSARRCLAPTASELRIEGVEPLAPNAIRLSFEQPIAGVAERASFLITALDGGAALGTTGAEVFDQDRRLVTVFTAFQSPGVTYSVRVLALSGLNGEGTPDTGLTAQFQGYVENTPRALVLNAPPSATQGAIFSITVNAVTVPVSEEDEISLLADIESELDWTMSVSGVVEEISSTEWNLGTRSFELVVRPDAPLADGASTPITLQASARDDPALRGASGVISLLGAVGLERFEVLAPATAQVSSPFTVTLRAVGSDGRLLTDFSGEVRLTSAAGVGTITPASTDDFVNGETTLEVTFDAVTPDLRILATVVGQAMQFGESERVQVSLDPNGAFSPVLTAVPLGSDRVRLDWTRIAGAEQYVLARAEDDGEFTTVATLVSGLYSLEVDELSGGTSYRFRLEGRAGDSLLGVAETVVVPKNCTLLSTSSIQSAFSFVAAESPYCVDNPTGNEIAVSAALTADAGVVLLFLPGTSLRLVDSDAAIAFVGTAEAPVILTSLELDAPWSGLILDATSTGTTFSSATGEFESGSRLSHVILDYADAGVYGLDVSVPLSVNALTVRHTLPASRRAIRFSIDEVTVIERSQVLQSAGMFVSMGDGARLNLLNTVWAFNAGDEGGAWEVRSNGVDPRVLDRGSFYYRNAATATGGAVLISSRLDVEIEDGVFWENTASRGGAIESGGVLNIRRSEFRSNVSETEGGAINAFRGSIENSRLQANRAEIGGALHSFNVDQAFSVVDVFATSNRATVRGGALAGHLRVSNSTLAENEAPLGGALSIRSQRSGFLQNSCVMNVASFGGCMAILDSTPIAPFSFARNNLRDNTALEGGSSNVSNESCSPAILSLESTYWGGETFGVESSCTSASIDTQVNSPAPVPWTLCVSDQDAVDCVGAR